MYVYKTTNKINNLIYIGLSFNTTKNSLSYIGSGSKLKKDIIKYGKCNFIKEILKDNIKSDIELYQLEKYYIDKFNSTNDQIGYNITTGGQGITGRVLIRDANNNFSQVSVNDTRYKNGKLKYFQTGFVNVKDKNGNTMQVKKNDPRFLSGELVSCNCNLVLVYINDRLQKITKEEYYNGKYKHVTKDKVVVKDKYNNNFLIHKNDPRFLSGELVPIAKDKVSVKDKNGNNYQVDINDPRYISGELVSITKDRIVVKDKKGNKFQVNINDPRFLSGELVHIAKGRVSVKDKFGNTLQVDINDSRYISGELVHIAKNTVTVKDKDNNTLQVDINDSRYISGELVHIAKGKVVVKDKKGNIKYINIDDPEYTTNNLKHICCKFSKQTIFKILIYKNRGLNCVQISKILNCNSTTISSIIRGDRKSYNLWIKEYNKITKEKKCI